MTAIVFVSGLSTDSRFRLGGLSLLERALIVARRAGVRRCLVVGDASLPSRRSHLPRLTPVADLEDALAVLRAENGSGSAAAPPSLVLCLHANVVTTPPSLERFIASADGPLVALRALPVALVDAGTLPDVWAQIADPEADALDRVRPAQFTSLPQGFFAWVRQAEQAAEVERRLLLDLPNPRDGRVDTRLNRHLSRPLTRFLLRSPLTPNQVTVLSLISSLFAAWAFARGRYGDSLLGALLFQFAAVLDCCDGEIARVKYLQSRFGDLLDIVCDAAGNLAVFVGIAYGAWVSGHLDDVRLVSWSLVVGITITFVLVTWGERRPAPATDTARRLIAALSTRDFSVLIFAAALTSTLPWFIRGAAIGVHVFWITLAILLRRSSAAPATRSSTPPGP